jgi:hypothetical protein
MGGFSQLIRAFLKLLGIVSFIVVIWKNPKFPTKVLLISVAVFFLSFAYYNSRPSKNRFLPVHKDFVLLDKQQEEHLYNWKRFVLTYGTNMSIEEVRDYYRNLVNKKGLLDKIAKLTPGGDFIINYRQLNEYGNLEEGGLLLDIQYGMNDSVSISITTPLKYEGSLGYRTQIYAQYDLETFSSFGNYLKLMSLLVLMSIVWIWILMNFVKGIKESLVRFNWPKFRK